MQKTKYSKPGKTGGRLIREVIKNLRRVDSYPITSDILIGVSGGPDSIALAHLLIKYGHRVGDKSKITLVHINHHWRGVASLKDADFVARFSKKFRVKFILRDLKPPNFGDGKSWEDEARKGRQKVFKDLAQESALVLTAHHADDLAETMLWRLFTGASSTHGGGIRLRTETDCRPLLNIRKSELIAYLKEEKMTWRKDKTNSDPRFLRARMRKDLLPVIEAIFPKAVSHLIEIALKNQNDKSQQNSVNLDPKILFSASGVNVRRAHFQALEEKISEGDDWRGEIHLPDGWKLLRPEANRWILEKT